MNDIFTYRDEIEGKIGIGKLPSDLLDILEDIRDEYYSLIPNKDSSTYHTWYNDMPKTIKSKVKQIQNNDFWNKLCDGSDKCIKINANEMDELYYSNPKNNLNKINLYGAASNYDIHKDCVYNFDGIKFYRVIIGLTNGNDNIITYFNNLKVGHKINSGDYIVFDFDKSTHQVIKDKQELTPRILLKLHYIVCENCNYSNEYIENIKKRYLYYEFITRYIMKTGTDPETYYEFFMGLICQYFYTANIEYIILLIYCIIFGILTIFKIKFFYSFLYTPILLIFIFLIIVLFYWTRYKLLGIR